MKTLLSQFLSRSTRRNSTLIKKRFQSDIRCIPIHYPTIIENPFNFILVHELNRVMVNMLSYVYTRINTLNNVANATKHFLRYFSKSSSCTSTSPITKPVPILLTFFLKNVEWSISV